MTWPVRKLIFWWFVLSRRLKGHPTLLTWQDAQRVHRERLEGKR